MFRSHGSESLLLTCFLLASVGRTPWHFEQAEKGADEELDEKEVKTKKKKKKDKDKEKRKKAKKRHRSESPDIEKVRAHVKALHLTVMSNLKGPEKLFLSST